MPSRPDQPGPVPQRPIAAGVLQRMAHLVSRDRDRGQRASVKIAGTEAYGFCLGIVMITLVCFLDGDVLQLVPIQQMACQVGPAATIAVSRFGVFAHHMTNPQAGPKDQCDDDKSQDE